MDEKQEEDVKVPEVGPEKREGPGKEHQQAVGAEEKGQLEDVLETEGELVLEHTVERPPDVYFHTLLEEERKFQVALIEFKSVLQILLSTY